MTSLVQPEIPWWRRVFAPANVVSVVVGLIVFAVLADRADDVRGALLAAGAGAATSALTWLALERLGRRDDIEQVLASPRVGSIPWSATGPTPALTDPQSPAAQAYRDAVERLEALTNGQVILVASPAPGQGATAVAVNLAIAATQAGRRVVLIDGDVVTRGLSRFGGTAPSPGLTELALGKADLAAASRLWDIGPAGNLPVIPAGGPVGDAAEALKSTHLADALDRLTERADLVFIDTAPILWDDGGRPLAAHADGTLLVVAPTADAGDLARTFQRLEDAGAPVLGYVVNRVGGRAATPRWRRVLKRAATTFGLIVLAYSAWNAVQLWDSWTDVGRDQLDVAAASELLPLPSDGIVAPDDVTAEAATAVTSPPSPRTDGDEFETFLVVGSDIGGERADVILYVLIPHDGSPPIMASIPRDLYLPNRCTQTFTRINANLAGCGTEVNGPTLLALAVSDFTGIHVDHFALFDFDGFERVIDALGGVEICVRHPVRDIKSFLDLPAGCTNANGEQALAWIRSRHTEEYVNGTWRAIPNVNDLVRNRRQQDLMIALLGKLKEYPSPAALTRTVRSVADAFTLDDNFGISEAINLAWDLRGLDPNAIKRIRIPVTDHVAPDGAQVLLPTRSFAELLAEVYPDSPTATRFDRAHRQAA